MIIPKKPRGQSRTHNENMKYLKLKLNNSENKQYDTQLKLCLEENL